MSATNLCLVIMTERMLANKKSLCHKLIRNRFLVIFYRIQIRITLYIVALMDRSVAASGRSKVRFLMLVLVWGHLGEAEDGEATLQAVIVRLLLAVNALRLVPTTWEERNDNLIKWLKIYLCFKSQKWYYKAEDNLFSNFFFYSRLQLSVTKTLQTFKWHKSLVDWYNNMSWIQH